MFNTLKKIIKLLSAKEQKRLYLLFAAMTFSAIIQVAGIASIMPFLAAISNPGIIQDNQILNYIYSSLNFQSINRFLIFIGISVLFILIISNLLLLLTHWGLFRFTWMRGYTLSKRLLSKYLYRPYVFFLNQSTSSLGKNILSEINEVVRGVIVPLMEIFSHSIVAIFIFAMLLAVNPLLAVFVLIILGGFYVFIYKLVQKKLRNIGRSRFKTNTERFKAVNEAFGGIKQLKLSGNEDVFINRFANPSLKFAKYMSTNQTISETPRYLMEIAAFGGVIVVVLYLLTASRGFNEVLPLIGLYAFSAYRLLPALQKIFGGAAKLRFSLPALDSLYEDIQAFKDDAYKVYDSKNKIDKLSLKNEIKIEKISFSYPGTAKPVIKDLNIIIKANTSVAFVGETGSGKTTIADIILGLLLPQKGKILIDNAEINTGNIKNWQKNLGYIPQDIYLQDDTVAKNIAFGIPEEKIDMDAIKQAAIVANIDDFIVKKLPQNYNTIIGERGVRLSGGQKQRIGIARALYHNPGVLVLDEATSALDGATENAVFSAIYNIAKTKTLIIIAHRLSTVQFCDIIYVLDNGKITAHGKYDFLMQTSEEFRKIAKAYNHEA